LPESCCTTTLMSWHEIKQFFITPNHQGIILN
jgi:hypothetical protein